MITVKSMTTDDILEIPSELLTNNRIAGSKTLELDETVWRKRAIAYAVNDMVEVLGAYDSNGILGIAFVIWSKVIPTYMISNLRLFHNMPGFPVDKNGYAALLSTIIEKGENDGRWEFYMRRNLEYDRWFNEKYIKKVYNHVPLSRKYLITVEDIILSNQHSRWKSINILCNNEIVKENTAIIKYFCPQKDRNLDYFPQDIIYQYKDTFDIFLREKWWNDQSNIKT